MPAKHRSESYSPQTGGNVPVDFLFEVVPLELAQEKGPRGRCAWSRAYRRAQGR